MILSYKKQFPWKGPDGKPVPTNFKEKILSGTKIHTFREDPHGRWKDGKLIHHAHGVRTKNYDCFLENGCVSVQSIQINNYDVGAFIKRTELIIDGEVVFSEKSEWAGIIAKNDGFDSVEDFFKWFSSDFQGRIIHWTDFKY